jgi:hypothetical protein
VTAAGGSSGRRGTGRIVLVVVAVVGALFLVGALTADPRTGEPYDPNSTSPDGVRAFVELLEHFGAEVEVATDFLATAEDADVAFAFEDVVPSDREDAVIDWVADGGTLVMADATSELTPEADLTASTFDTVVRRGGCDIEAFDGIESIETGEDTAGARFVPRGGGPRCFDGPDGAYAVLRAEGAGQILSLAEGTPFMNANLDELDNAVLAVALAAPRPGTRVMILTGDSFPGSTSDEDTSVTGSLGNIIEGSPTLMLAQLGVALVVFAFARGRRVGRPLIEPQPVQIAGSALVSAVGDLLARRRDPDHAAQLLRADLRRTIAERTGMPAHAPPEALADALSSRTSRTAGEVLTLLADHRVTSDAELVALADQIDSVRQEVLHGRSP